MSCLHAGVKRGWPVALLENEALSEGVADRLVAGLVEILQGSDEPHLSSALCPERALQDVSENLSSRSALFARITAAVAAATGEPLDAGLVVPVLSHAMASGAAWIRQLLMGLVMAELPPGTAARADISRLATGVLLRASIDDAVGDLLGEGAFSVAFLGSEARPAPHTIFLAVVVLRKVAADGLASDMVAIQCG